MTLSSRGCKTEKGTYFPMLNYTVECNEENITWFKRTTGKLIEEKSVMEMQSSSQKVPKLETKFPLLSFIMLPLLAVIRARRLTYMVSPLR